MQRISYADFSKENVFEYFIKIQSHRDLFVTVIMKSEDRRHNRITLLVSVSTWFPSVLKQEEAHGTNNPYKSRDRCIRLN